MMCIITRYFNTLREAMVNEELNQQGFYLQGKFEGQSPLAKAFYNQYLDVGAEDNAGSVAGNGVHLFGWTMKDHEMHQLDVKRYVVLAGYEERFVLEEYNSEQAYRDRIRQIYEPDYHRELMPDRLEQQAMVG